MNIFLIILVIFFVSLIWTVFSYFRIDHDLSKIKKAHKELKRSRVIFQSSR